MTVDDESDKDPERSISRLQVSGFCLDSMGTAEINKEQGLLAGGWFSTGGNRL